MSSDARTTTTTTTSGGSRAFDRYRGTPAEIYDDHFVPAIGSPFATALVDLAAPRPGESVLDVGCGTGVVARLAAERVGADGTVAGIDGHPGMLQVARTTDESGSIDWREASAEGLPFPDASFDLVLCSLALQFFADKVLALREMGRVAVPGGRVAIGVPGPVPPLFEAFHDVLADGLGADAAAFVRAVFALDDAGRLASLVGTAGLDDVETTNVRIRLRLDPPTDFLWQYLLGTPLAEVATELDATRRGALERELERRWEPFATADGVEGTIDAILATARRPAG
jgi:SAM-dependent methyltransferase